jgi:uncharacterized protein YraI
MKFELPPPLPEKRASRFRQAPEAPSEGLPNRSSQTGNGVAPAGDENNATPLSVAPPLPLQSSPTVAAGFSPPKSKRFSATHIIAAVGILVLGLILLGSWMQSAKFPAGTAYVSSDNNRVYSTPSPTPPPQPERIPTWDEVVSDPRFQKLPTESRLLVLDHYRDELTKRAVQANGGKKLSYDDAKTISDWYLATKAKLSGNAHNLQESTTEAAKAVPTVSAMPTLPPVNATPSATPTASVMRGALVYHVVNVANGDYLNLRSGAGSTYPVVGRLAAGTGNISSTGKTRKNGNTTWTFISAESISGWANADFLQPGDAKVNPPSPTPSALKSPPISEAEERAKYWESRGYHFDPDIYAAFMMDQKVVDIDRAKYWEARGYHFDPNIYAAFMMDQEVERIKGSQH